MCISTKAVVIRIEGKRVIVKTEKGIEKEVATVRKVKPGEEVEIFQNIIL